MDSNTQADRTKKQWEVITLNSLLIFFTDFGISLSIPPQTKIFGDIICQQLYGDRALTGDGAECRGAAVQSELARIAGWKSTFEAVPSVLLSLSYGAFADRVGRKPCLQLSILGIFLSETWTRIVCLWPQIFPLRLVWISGLWRSVGGGACVIDSIMCVMIMEVFDEGDRAVALLQLHSVFIVAKIFAAPTSASMMALGSPWTPFFIGLGMIFLAQAISFLLPETINPGAFPESDDSRVMQDDPESPILRSMPSVKSMFANRNMLPILIVNLVASSTKSSIAFLLQYSSIKYGWTYSWSSLVLTVLEGSNLATYLILMPAVTAVLRRAFHAAPTIQDRRLCQASGLLNVLGFLSIAAADTPASYMLALVLLSLGSAFDTAMSSFATSAVRPDQIARLHSAAATAKSVGGLLAGPVFAFILQWGLTLDPEWLGMPYIVAGLLSILALMALSLIRVKPQTMEEASRQPLIHADA